MSGVVWAEASDDDGGDDADTEAHGEVDETFASRRLRRWLRGMFGGGQGLQRPPEDEEER